MPSRFDLPRSFAFAAVPRLSLISVHGKQPVPVRKTLVPTVLLMLPCLLALGGAPLLADDFFTVTPCRALDTRTTHQTFMASGTQAFAVGNTCGIPNHATAVSLNATLVATAPVDMAIYPGDQFAQNNTVSANLHNPTVAAATVVQTSTDGQGTVKATATFANGGQTDLLLDVNGYFLPHLDNSCPFATGCRALAHFSLSEGTNPYTEDILLQQDGVKVTGPSSAWTVVQTACPNIEGNLNGSTTFNAILRAQLVVQASETTAPVGTLYEVQLTVDGVEHGWYLRRLILQPEVFAGVAQNLPPGPHTFAVQVRVDDPGTISFNLVYINAFGTPNTLPSDKVVTSAQAMFQSSSYVTVAGSSHFTNTAPVDVVIDGYFQVDGGVAGQQVALSPFLDGVQQIPVTYVGIPPALSSGVNMLHILPNVPAGTHTLDLRALTFGNSLTLSNREIEYVSFPATTYYGLTSASNSVAVQSNTTQAQPLLETSCGLWSKLLEFTIPPDSVDSAFNLMLEGYIHFPGAPSDYTPPVTWGELAFYVQYPNGAATDAGERSVIVPLTNNGTGVPYPDGAYIFGDTGLFAEAGQPETVQLWARKVNATCNPSYNGLEGAFNVTDRFLWARIVPNGGACMFN